MKEQIEEKRNRIRNAYFPEADVADRSAKEDVDVQSAEEAKTVYVECGRVIYYSGYSTNYFEAEGNSASVSYTHLNDQRRCSCYAGWRCRRNGYDVISVHHPVENRKRKWGAEMCRRFRTFLLYKYFRNKKCFSEAVISRS